MTDIIEGNKLIAEFDGKFTTDMEKWVETNKILVGEYEYHSSWDWLMPVVEKINTIALDNFGEMNVLIASHECRIGEEYNHPIVNKTRDFKKPMIEMIWSAVVEFIKWYNNQNK